MSLKFLGRYQTYVNPKGRELGSGGEVIYTTCPDLLREAQSFEGEAITIDRKGKDPRTISFHQLLRLVRLAGANMAELGVGREDNVVLLGKNSIPWAGVFFGANSVLGAVPIPLSVEFRKEIEHIGESLEEVPLAVYEKGEVSSAQLGYLRKFAEMVVPFCEIAPLKPSPSNGEETAPAEPVEPESEPPKEIGFNLDVELTDTAVILYTSGTMGTPKGVPLTHKNVTANVAGTYQAFDLSQKDRLASIAPWDHVMGLNLNLVLCPYSGITVIYTDKYKQTLDLVREQEATIFLGVPKLFSGMIQQFERRASKAFDIGFVFKEVKKGLLRGEDIGFGGRIISSVRRLVSKTEERLFGLAYRIRPAWAGRLLKRKLGPQFRYFAAGGAPMSEEVLKVLDDMNLDIVVGYGVTENSPLITATDREETNRSSVGQPLHNVSVEINDPDESGVGEVLISGPSLFEGYKDLPELTEEKFEGRWYRTGDMGKFEKGASDQDVLTLVGRKGNIIVPATGVTVYAEEVEAALRELNRFPWIETFFVREGIREERSIVELIIEIEDSELKKSIEEGTIPPSPFGKTEGKGVGSDILDDEKIKEAVRGRVRKIIRETKEELAPSKLPKRKILVKRDGLRRTATLDIKREQEIPEEKVIDQF